MIQQKKGAGSYARNTLEILISKFGNSFPGSWKGFGLQSVLQFSDF